MGVSGPQAQLTRCVLHAALHGHPCHLAEDPRCQARPPDTGSPRLRPSFVPCPLKGHPSPARVRPRRPGSLQTVAGPGDSSVHPRSQPVPPALLRPDRAPVLSQEVGGPAHPDLGRSQGGVTAGARAGGQGGGSARRDRGLSSSAALAARGQQAGQRAAAGSRQAGQKQHSAWPGRAGQARARSQGPRTLPLQRQPPAWRHSSGVHPQGFIPRGAQSVREGVRLAFIGRLSPGEPSRSGRGSGRLVSPPSSWGAHLLLCHGVQVTAVRAEHQVTQNGAALLGHHALVGQRRPAAGVREVHQDLWERDPRCVCVGGVFLPQPLSGKPARTTAPGPTSSSDADRSLGVGVPRDRTTTAQHPPHPWSRAAWPQPRRGQWARPGVPGEGLFVQRGGDTWGAQCRQRPPRPWEGD